MSQDDVRAVRWRWAVGFAVVVTIVAEIACLAMRFGAGLTATEFNRSAPLLLQIHHMIWAAPLIVTTPFIWRFPRIGGAVAGTAAGLVISDLLHHFVVLPLLVGNTGWHWP